MGGRCEGEMEMEGTWVLRNNLSANGWGLVLSSHGICVLFGDTVLMGSGLVGWATLTLWSS